MEEGVRPEGGSDDNDQKENSMPVATTISAQAPGQIRIFGQSPGTSGNQHDGEDDFEMGGSAASAGIPVESDRVELVSGPHLRSVVAWVCFLLWLAVRIWEGHAQLYLLPAVLLCTTSTSALWCTPTELAVSLGPVPVCFFRRRITYKDIASVKIVRGRFRQFATLMWQGGTRFWQPHGYMYGLTLGKALVEISLQQTEATAKIMWWPSRLLVSVDEAEGVVAHVLFRQKYGTQKPLLTPQP